MDRKIGICIAGYGGFARKQLHPRLAKMDECEVKYLFHPNEKKAQSYGPKGTNAIDMVCNDPDIHAFVIATPYDTHIKFLERLVRENKHHIFVEKPMTASYQEITRFSHHILFFKKVFMVGHCQRREAVYRKAKELLEDGRIGRLINVNFNVSSSKVFTISETDWRASAVRNDLGPLAMVGSHCIDTVHYLFGKAESVYARLQNVSGKTEAPDSSSVVMNLENGATVFLQCNYNVPSEKYCFISGTEGAIYIERDKVWIRSSRETYKDAPSEKQEMTITKVDLIEEELKEFLNAIKAGGKVETGYAEGLAVVQVLEACRESSLKNKVIRLS